MNDTLKQHAEKFRKKWDGVLEIRECGHSDHRKNHVLTQREALIAEIKWARENPPVWDSHDQVFARYIWQSALDHLLACLGEK